MTATLASLVAMLPGVATGPGVFHNISRLRAEQVVMTWQTSAGDTFPPSGYVAQFRVNGFTWRCSLQFRTHHSYDYMNCAGLKHRVSFRLRWPWQGFDNGVHGCPPPRVLPGLNVADFGMTKGIGCKAARDIVERMNLPNHNTIFHPPGFWCSMTGNPGNASGSNGATLLCFTVPKRGDSLTNTVWMGLGWLTTPGGPLCGPNPKGECTWENRPGPGEPGYEFEPGPGDAGQPIGVLDVFVGFPT